MMEFAVRQHNESVSRSRSTAHRIFELYFGKDPTKERIAFVADKLQRLLHSLQHTTYVCRKSQGDCISFASAMVVGGSKPDFHAPNGQQNARVDICPAYFNRPGQLLARRPRATAFQIQVLVHEGVHTLLVPEAPAGINDLESNDPNSANLTYGTHHTQKLAAYSPEAALVSADNYRQYVAALLTTYETGRMPKHENIDHGIPPEWTSLWQDDLRSAHALKSLNAKQVTSDADITPCKRTSTSTIGSERTIAPILASSMPTIDAASLPLESSTLIDSTSKPSLANATSEAIHTLSSIRSTASSATPSKIEDDTSPVDFNDDSSGDGAKREDRLKQAVGFWPDQYDWTKLSAAPAHVVKWWAPYTLVAIAAFMGSM
ncbi:Putative metallopeptidase, catalytic domain superfamily [Septoria linicola]|uniref:Metallopeptidase, catalytic domain superfamily n=1 Tax=Septoria linicola TaxID=215465 RepID=A0A9Q9ARR6_9PEZI|nr:Putative metallopeptidase, catalytic domain superfamily [Septoria linicola]